jgi:hypothetical protein
MNFILVQSKPAAGAEAAAVPQTHGRRIRQAGEMVTALSAPKRQAEASSSSDRRWALRKRTEMPGYIGHSKNPQGVRCVVRNTSSSGALIEVCSGSDRFANPADEIPDQLTLVFISYKERSEVACAVMRRAGRMLGVRYIGPFRSFPMPGANSKLATHIKKR